MMGRNGWIPVGCTLVVLMGCATIPPPMEPGAEAQLRDGAMEALKRAVRYEHAAHVRALGIEVMERRLGDRGLPWIRNALHDEDATVQYAAVFALGSLKDRESYAHVRALADSGDEMLKVAAIYALHRLGDTSRTGELPDLLLDHPSADVRRAVAFVLGLLEQPKAVKILARAMKDKDEFVQQQALESMATLGSAEAIQQLTFAAGSGHGAKRVSAINALARLELPSLQNSFEYRLAKGDYLDTRLAAAYALGRLGSDAGFRVALKSLDFDRPQRGVSQDPPEAQIQRIRQLAANALGAIGDRRALAALERRLNDQSDPWIQVAVADAILDIVGTGGPIGISRASVRRDGG